MSAWNKNQWKSPEFNHGYDVDDIEQEMATENLEVVHTHKAHSIITTTTESIKKTGKKFSNSTTNNKIKKLIINNYN